MNSKQERQKRYWSKNKEAINERRRKRYRENPTVREQTYLRREKWQTENPEKYQQQILLGKSRRLKLRFEIFKRDHFKCVYCGIDSNNAVLHIDHIIPKSKGGLNKLDNLVTACESCNLGKSDVLLT